jgi:hypothetical protein
LECLKGKGIEQDLAINVVETNKRVGFVALAFVWAEPSYFNRGTMDSLKINPLQGTLLPPMPALPKNLRAAAPHGDRASI